MEKLRQRLGREEGFTLIELLVVIVIIGILLAIAVPSYLGFKDRANNRAAQSDIRAAVPSMEAYYSDHGKYTSVTPALIRSSIDSGLSRAVSIADTINGTYCLTATVGSKTWSLRGPGAVFWSKSANCDVTKSATP
jgi:type IV pilus assembly protein PilA